jgi:hypothetical protein
LSLNLAVFWLVREVSQQKGMARRSVGIRKAGSEAEGYGPGLCASGWLRMARTFPGETSMIGKIS